VTQVPARDPRALLAVCVGLAGSAALFWGASATTWFRIAGPPGRPATESTGADVAPSLTGFALLALAAVAALVATAGPLRRVVAALLVLVGAVVGVVVVQAALDPPGAAGAAASNGAAWQALDAGTDPTADVPGSRGDDPDVGGRTGPG
jgi:hypothetical protein